MVRVVLRRGIIISRVRSTNRLGLTVRVRVRVRVKVRVGVTVTVERKASYDQG